MERIINVKKGRRSHFRVPAILITILIIILLPTLLQGGEPLHLSEAESLATGRDLPRQVSDKISQGFLEESRSAAQFADPQLILGYEDEPAMNQVMVGVRQEIPRLKNLDLGKSKMLQMAAAEKHRGDLALRTTLRDVRLAWFELWLQSRTIAILEHHVALLSRLTGTAEEQYAAGSLSQQQLVMLQLEEQMQRDRLLAARESQEAGRARLARLVGVDEAGRPLPEPMPEMPVIGSLSELQLMLPQHPAVLAAAAGIRISDIETELADQYFSGAMIDLLYGRSDQDENRFAVMLSLPIPINPGDRQQSRTAARRYQADAARLQQEEILRTLQSEVESNYRRLLRQEERLAFYRQVILPQSLLVNEATLSSYRQGTDDFFNLMRATVYEQENELNRVRLQVEWAKTQTLLLFYQGDRQ